MKTIKRKCENFKLYDYKAMETHLTKMAAQGWKLDKITAFYWQYRRIEPQKLKFTVIYLTQASEFNPFPTEKQKTFYNYCEESGWLLIAQRDQTQIFCSELENPTPIETDEIVKLQAIHKSMKKTFIPSQVTFVGLFLLYTISLYYYLTNDPIQFLCSSYVLYFTLIITTLGISPIISLVRYFFWYHHSQKSIAMGGSCFELNTNYKKHQFLSKLGLGLMLVLTVIYLSSFLEFLTFGGILMFFAPPLMVILLSVATQTILKRKKVSKNNNLSATMFILFFSSFSLPIIITGVISSEMEIDFFKDNSVGIYTKQFPNGVTIDFDMYDDPIPLKLEDIQDVNFDNYSCQWTSQATFLASYYEATQVCHQFAEDDIPELTYEIADLKSSILFEFILKDYLKVNYRNAYEEEQQSPYPEINALPWEADRVYQLHSAKYGARSSYIVCWGYRILTITFDEIPTDEQIAIVVDKIKSTDLSSID